MLAFKGFKDGEVRAFDAAMFAAMGTPDPVSPVPAALHYVDGHPVRPSKRIEHGPSSSAHSRHGHDPLDGQ
jgi:hypothetical protein